MSAPAWFNYETYLVNKLAQLKTADPEQYGDFTEAELKASMLEAGYSNDADGMYRHFVDFGNAENVSPSPYFVVSEYMANKLAQLQHDEPAAGWDMVKLEQAFKDAGLSAWDHYERFGQDEGIAPSSLFDTNAYLAAKLAQLQRDEPNAGWESVDQVVDAFQANGLNPIEHYVLFGVNEALTYTPVAPVEPEKPVTDELTTERDVLNLGAGDHVIGGVASSLSAEKTLNENDLIDGGEGNDTLRVTMNANFNGFTVTDDPNTTGGMKNVENVELTNNGQIARTFSAKGIDGATTYTLKAGEAGTGAINLKDLSAAGVTVNVDGLQSGSTSVDFATGALDGAEDSLTLGLTNVGSVDGDDVTSVNVSASSGLESVTINASGPNYVDLSGVDAPSLAMTGSGALNISAVNAALESFDGSAATGNVAADLTGADEIKSLVGTQGDDTFTVKNLNPVATIDGGAGNDTLWLDGITGNLQPTISGFETIGVKENIPTGLTISGKNAQDFSAVSLENGGVTLASLNASTFTVNSLGQTDGNDTANAATLSDNVQLTVNVEAAADAAASQNIATVIMASKATDAVINVGANVAESGDFTFAKAQSVQLNVTGNVVDGENQTSFNADLNAANATDLSVTAGADVTLDVDSNLEKVQSLNITQNDYAFDAKTNPINFAALNSLNVSGSGKDAAAKFANLGAATNTYRLNVTADGLAKGLEFGTVATQDDVTLDFANVSGNVTQTTGSTIIGNNVSVQVARLADSSVIRDITASGSVTVDASDNLSDTLNIGNINVAKWGSTDVKANAAVSVTVDGAAENLVLGGITNNADKGTVTLDLSGYLNDVNGGGTTTVGAISASTVNLYGSELGSNIFASSSTSDITANTLAFTGGLDGDQVELTGWGTGKAIKATLDTGADDDTVTITGIATTETITVSGDMGGNTNDIINITAGATAHSVKIDISKLGGYTTSDITGVDNQSDTIIGGSGDDTITAGAVTFATKGSPAVQGEADYPSLSIQTALAAGDKLTIGSYESGDTGAISDVSGLITFINSDSTLNQHFEAVASGAGMKLIEKTAGADINSVSAPTLSITGTATGSLQNSTGTVTQQGKAEVLATDGTCDTLTGGAGDDIFDLSVATASTSKTDKATTIITDFNAEEDKITIDSFLSFVTAATPTYDTLDAMLDGISGDLTATAGVLVGAQVGSSTYLVMSGDASSGTNTHTAIIELQGVNLDDLRAGDMIGAPA